MTEGQKAGVPWVVKLLLVLAGLWLIGFLVTPRLTPTALPPAPTYTPYPTLTPYPTQVPPGVIPAPIATAAPVALPTATPRPVPTLAPAPTPKPVLSATSFEIVSSQMKWEGSYLWLVGELKNVGSVPAGAELEVIARDAKGVLIDSATFWPNSVNNLPPGGTCGIKYPVTRDATAVRLDVKVINAQVWRQP
jgi:hypothetical protein